MKAIRVGDTGVLMILAGAAALAWIVKDHLTTPYDPLFEAAADKHALPSNLLRAIARVESDFQRMARDPKTGDYANGSHDTGMMQVNSKTAVHYGFSDADMLDPAKNVECACRLLVDLRRELGTRLSDYTLAASYNVGSDLLPAAQATEYGARVMFHWQLYSLGRMFA